MTQAHPLSAIRDRLLSTPPGEVKAPPTKDLPNVWGVLVERGHARGGITLLCLIDGTVSLYLPGGAGVIGAGKEAPVRAAAIALLLTTEFALGELAATTDFAYPPQGDVRFLALTRSGVRAVAAPERELAQASSVLATLFFAGEALATQVRLAAQRKQVFAHDNAPGA